MHPAPSHRSSRRMIRSLLAAATLAAAGLTAPASGLAAGDHGDHGGSTSPLPADVDRCDLGFNSQAYNDAIKAGKQHDLKPSWPEQFLPFEPGYSKLSFWDKLAYNAGAFITNDVWRGMQATGHDGHALVDPWQGMTDPVQCDALKGQLRQVLAAVRKYPTLGMAQRAGYGMRTPYFAGSGAHVVLKGVEENPDYEADPAVPPSLLYDGMGKNAAVVGAMFGYETDRDMNTRIFDTPNGSWHQHMGLCYLKSPVLGMIYPNATRMVIGSEATSEAACKRRGGYKDPASSLYMMHVWVVPGCENPFGMFAHDNPRLTTTLNVRSGRAGNRGCGTGKAVTDPVGLQTDELNTPGKLTTYRSSAFTWAQNGQTVAAGPVAMKVGDHPGEAHAGGEIHLAGTMLTEDGFSGATGSWPVSIIKKDGVLRGSITTPSGTVASFTGGSATATERGVEFTASATVPGGEAVQLSVDFADRSLRDWFLGTRSSGQESLAIRHPAHGHDHAAGPVTFALGTHPGENHVGEEHLFGTATTKDGFTGTTGAWVVSFTKNTTTHAINGYLKSPDELKRFNFSISAHHDAEECSGGVHLTATGSEQATPADPQNPELVICDPAVTAFFADHVHAGSGAETPVPTTPEHQH